MGTQYNAPGGWGGAVDGGRRGALDGLRIADFSRVLAGPYATMLLADLGADVVKVERPETGDDTRAWHPPADHDGTSTYFLSVNRNKRSVVLDLTTEAGLEQARALIAESDVLVENFRPGTMERLGLGHEELRARHPELIYCSISGFGSGAGAAIPGYDLLVQAVGGLMSVTGDVHGEPVKAGVALVDVITGLHASLGILAALRHRDATGEGQLVEVNLLGSLLSAMVNQASAFAVAGVVPGRMGNAHPSIAPYETLPTADRPLALAVGNDRQFAALAEVVGDPGLALDDRFRTNSDRVAHRAELWDILTERLSAAGADHWAAVLLAAGVPAGPVNTLDEAFAFAQKLGLPGIVDIPAAADGEGGRPSRQVAHPITLSGTPAQYRLPPPGLGQHTAQILHGPSDLSEPSDHASA
ncbi:CaiB/BaiF CoA transferase family protein [Streptomyces jeddahensis]|uniref:Succinyl-CoA:(R)-benzylsuccinate CoA-transferase subunit BbsF n=1 Tax=Streptomyces jeddahensis TaxID=1716141 RepID=A0A177HNQ9_9ACTN|nr:CoA transferase [Streptomyces jeddahensis]OAH12250.1 succinyl-CoA:(R)-benzylsuccinate CoA-transferase subunit BbsF [Streptomyces jeddahensis]